MKPAQALRSVVRASATILTKYAKLDYSVACRNVQVLFVEGSWARLAKRPSFSLLAEVVFYIFCGLAVASTAAFMVTA